jgi:Holliday junction resolvase RusA-like endonuclease
VKLEFTVYGTPQPQGSARAFIPKGWKRAVITSDNPNLKSWRQELAKAAMAACFDAPHNDWPLHGRIPVQVALKFFFKPPKKVNCKEKTTRPDVDKLMRAALDGMTGIVYDDDSQVAHAQISKCFGVPERVEIYVGTC